MKSGTLARYTCLYCHHHYYVDFNYNGRNHYFCPHCGKQSMNLGKYFAKDVVFQEETFREWDTNSIELYDLVQYLDKHYPEGWGEDIVSDLEDVLLNNLTVEEMETYKDEQLKQLIDHVIQKHKETKKEA